MPSGTPLLQASPPALCPHGRTWDLKAVLAVMWGAQKFIYASVMEYFPTTRFTHPARLVWVRAQTQRVEPTSLMGSSWVMFPYLLGPLLIPKL